MSNSATTIALARLTEAVGLDISFGSPGEPIEIQHSPGTSTRPAWHINEQPLLEYQLAELAGYLGLIRLALLSGYVDLAGWEYTSSIAATVALLEDKFDHPRMLNVRELARQLSSVSGETVQANPVAFDAFESYLSLTRWVFSDQPLIDALDFVHGGWNQASDLPALLGPRHMASAIATGHVGVVEVPGFAGMLSALEAYEWLASIVNRVSDLPDLHDGMLAHARWSHAAWVSRQRVDNWALAMSEWSPQRDVDGEAHWMAFREQVLLELEGQQDGLKLAGTKNSRVGRDRFPSQMSWSDSVRLDQLDARAAELVKEGRDEAARRTLIQALKVLSITVSKTSNDNARARLLVYAQRLADLGDLDSAAAFVAPYPEQFATDGEGPTFREIFAADLIARARRAGMVGHPTLSQAESSGPASGGGDPWGARAEAAQSRPVEWVIGDADSPSQTVEPAIEPGIRKIELD